MMKKNFNNVSKKSTKNFFLNNLEKFNISEIINFISLNYEMFYEEDYDKIVEFIIKTKDAYFIHSIAFLKGLSKENKNALTKAIIKTKKVSYIVGFAKDVEGLSKENIDDLTKGIIVTKDAFYISAFAKDVGGLSKENIDDLTKGIIETNRIHYICDFLLGANGLSEKNRKDLIKTVYNFENCEEYLLKIIRKQKEKLSEKEIYNMLNKILKTKNKIYIAIALYYINDISLISQIFGSLKSYIIFLDLNMEKVERLGFKISTFNLKEQSVDDLSYSYVDDNIDTYFGRETGQKVLS